MTNANPFTTTIWVNPITEADNSTNSADVQTSGGIHAFAFRQATGIGTITIDDLYVATTFDEVMFPFITTQPQGQTNLAGGNLTLNVGAIGTALGYQWRKDGVALADGGSIAGALANSLVITGTTTNDSGNYTVIISNAVGMITSQVAAVSFTNISLAGPSITSEPLDVTNAVGASASFTVSATGTSPLSYQWFFGVDPLIEGGQYAGSTSNILTINNLDLADVGGYSVVVSNSVNQITSRVASLTVTAVPPTIVTNPQGLTVVEGSGFTLFVVADGTAPLAYQWRTNGTDVPLATASNYVINAATLADAGTYSVVVTNLGGSVTSAPAVVIVSSSLTPPSITMDPVGSTNSSGTNLTLAVQATGSTPLAFQWFFNGSILNNSGNISGTTTSNLLITAATTNNSGDYYVIVTNSVGSDTSMVATLLFTNPPVAPQITGQPDSQTNLAGADVSFSVTATGTGPLDYQWFYNSVPVADSANYFGSLSNVLTVSNISGTVTGQYFVIISNEVGTATSTVVVLQFTNAPVAPELNGSLVGFTNLAWTTNSLTVSASGDAPLGYYWYRGTNLIANTGRFFGAATATLTFSNGVSGDSGNYFVIVSNVAGFATSSIASVLITNPAVLLTETFSYPDGELTNAAPGRWAIHSFTATASRLLVSSGSLILTNGDDGNAILFGSPFLTNNTVTPAIYFKIDLKVLKLPTGTTADYFAHLREVGGSFRARLHVLTNGAAADRYRIAIGNNSSTVNQIPVDLATNTTYAVVVRYNVTNGLSTVWLNPSSETVGGVTASDAVNILPIASVAFRQSANIGVLSVDNLKVATSFGALFDPPTIVADPQSLTVGEGQNASFNVNASGFGLAYQWTFNGTNLDGYTTSNLTLSAVSPAQAGPYAVIVANALGSVTSAPATLTVTNMPPSIFAQPVDANAVEGTIAAFSVTAAGSQPFSYQWFFGTTPLSDQGDILGATSNVLTIANVAVADAGFYSVVITNDTGSITSRQAQLTVTGTIVPPNVTNNITSLSLMVGSNFSLAVSAGGSVPLGYQWYKDGGLLLNAGNISGVTSPILSVSTATVTDSGSYLVIVTNLGGMATSTPTVVTVTNPIYAPSFVVSPGSQSVTVGSNASFTALALGSDPITYRWYFNSVLLTGISGTNYSIASVNWSNAGTYIVIASNFVGMATSAPANLTVQQPARLTNDIATLRTYQDLTTMAVTNTSTYFTVTGLVTTHTNMTGGTGSSALNALFYIQDNSGGVAVFYSGGVANLPLAGSLVQVVARLTQFNGYLELAPSTSDAQSSLTVLSTNNLLPTPVPLDFTWASNPTIAETNESMYVVATNVFIDLSTPNFTANATVTITNQNGETFALFINRYTDIGGNPIPAGPVTIYGVLGQFDSASPYDSGYQLIPSRYEDVVASQKAPKVTFTNYLSNLIRPGDALTNTYSDHALRPTEKLTLNFLVIDPNGGNVTVQGLTSNLPTNAVWTIPSTTGSNVTGTFTFTPVAANSGSNFMVTLRTYNSQATNDQKWNVYVPTTAEQKFIISEYFANPTTNETSVMFNPLKRSLPWANNITINDEYVEVVSLANSDIVMDGWTIADATQVRMTIGVFTLSSSNSAVFYGGPANGDVPNVGTAMPIPVSTFANTAGLALNNNGDTITFRNAAGYVVTRLVYSDTQVWTNSSMARFPDLNSAFVPQSWVSTNVVSAGTQLNGADFMVPPPVPVGVSPTNISLSIGLDKSLNLSVTNLPAGVYTLWQSDDLTNKFKVVFGMGGNGSATFTDTTASNAPMRFYFITR
jgi:hypothetical protein